MTTTPNITVRGIRTPIPQGYVLGRISPGTGAVELIRVDKLSALGISSQSYATGSFITALTGDVTATGGGSAAATIASGAVTYAKMQDVSAASRLLGRGSASGSGDVEEITLGSGLAMTGTVLSATGGGGGGAFTDLSDVPSSYSGQALKYVRVNSTEDGLEFQTFPTIPVDFVDLGDVPASYTGAAGYFVKVNATEDALEFVAGGGGASDFTDLGDVPASYSGQALKYVRVNAGETGLEFQTFPTIPVDFTDLGDTPTNYSASAYFGVRVNSTETGVELYPRYLYLGMATGAFVRPSDIVCYARLPEKVEWGTDMSGSYAYSLTQPSGEVIFDIEESSLVIGTVTFDVGSNEGVFSLMSTTSSPGNSINIRSPADVKGLSFLSFTLRGLLVP